MDGLIIFYKNLNQSKLRDDSLLFFLLLLVRLFDDIADDVHVITIAANCRSSSRPLRTNHRLPQLPRPIAYLGMEAHHGLVRYLLLLLVVDRPTGTTTALLAVDRVVRPSHRVGVGPPTANIASEVRTT